MFYRYKNHVPQVHETAFVADGAKIIGNVKIGAYSNIWYNAVLRGDEGPIEIGNQVSIQENVTCHLYEGFPLIVEDDVIVGHNAIIHGCHIKKRCAHRDGGDCIGRCGDRGKFHHRGKCIGAFRESHPTEFARPWQSGKSGAGNQR